MTKTSPSIDPELAELCAEIVCAYVSRNAISPGDLPNLIVDVHATLHALSNEVEAAPDIKPVPATSIRKSVTPDHVVCLDCGKRLKTLRRHIFAVHNLDADAYRIRWGLAPDHPLVAPKHSDKRSKLAKKNGLGLK